MNSAVLMLDADAECEGDDEVDEASVNTLADLAAPASIMTGV